MPQLPPEWAAHLESGASHRVGSSHADGRPDIIRAVASLALPDGRIDVVLNRGTAHELLVAVGATRRIAYVASQPDTNRTLHVKGVDALAVEATPAHLQALIRSRERFVKRVEPFGFRPETIISFWFDLSIDQLTVVRFTPLAAWDQSPGPGAGQPIELLQ